MAVFHGTAGNNSFAGTADRDGFILGAGGDDTATGDGGNDVFRLRGALNALDQLDGGTGRDRLFLDGDYSAGVVFGATTITGIESMSLAGAFDYSLTMDNGNVAAGARLTVNARALGAGHHLTFDGSAELDGRFTIEASKGNDVLTGGAKDDRFFLGNGGTDVVHGVGGKDMFVLGAALTAADHIDGGTGFDTMVLDGTYNGGDDAPFFFSASIMTGIDRLELHGSHNYDLYLENDTIAAGETLIVDASQVGTGLLAVSADETDGHLHFIARTGDSAFAGGGLGDEFDMRHVPFGASSTANGGGGDDLIEYGDGFKYGRTVVYGGAGNDTVSFDGDYTTLRISATSSAFTVENLVFHGGHDYTGVVIDQDVTSNPLSVSGNTLHVDASALGVTDVWQGDLTGGTSASYAIALGAGNDSAALSGSGANSVSGGGGRDTITCNSAVDTLIYSASSDSASVNYDTVSGFDADNDKFDLFFSVSNIDAQSFSVDSSSFDTDMGTHLSDYICTVVTATGSGDLLGHKFLVINADTGDGFGYEAGVDLVIDITGYTGTLGTSDFI